jgi:MFS family permease
MSGLFALISNRSVVKLFKRCRVDDVAAFFMAASKSGLSYSVTRDLLLILRIIKDVKCGRRLELTMNRPKKFSRDRATWSAYLLLTFLTLQVSLIGPIMPFLRSEMGLTYAEGALHTSAFALGMMMAGFLCGPLERRVGRKSAMAIGALGLAIGFTMITMAPTPVLSIIGAGLMGLIGSMVVVFVPLVLMSVHGPQTDQAISESNFMSYIGALLAPIAVWFFAGVISWKAVGVISWAIALASIFALRKSYITPDSHPSSKAASPLGRSYWAYWTLLGLSVGVEFCFSVWGASFLEKISGLTRDNAIIGSTLFAFGVLCSRLAGIFIVQRIGPWRLAFVSLLIAMVGFFVFWLSSTASFVLIGLAISGLGVANLFATTLTLALAAEPNNSAKAAARTPITTGLAIILTPLVLGALADHVGLFAGYAIVPFLILLGMAALILGRHYRTSPQ